MDNKELYQKLQADKYIGRDGILNIEVKEHFYAIGHCYGITIRSTNYSLTELFLAKEINLVKDGVVEQIMHNVYSRYKKSKDKLEEENK